MAKSKKMEKMASKFMGATAYMGKGKYKQLNEKQYERAKAGKLPKGAHYIQKVSQ